MSDTLKDQWEPYESLVPFDTIAERIEFPQSCLLEDVQFLLPSLILAQDGPVVQSVFLITDAFLCEVRLSPTPHDFDVVVLSTIGNYRIHIGEQEIAREEPASETEPEAEKIVTTIHYKTVTITLNHTFGQHSVLTYVGKDPDPWIKSILDAIPIDLLTKSASG